MLVLGPRKIVYTALVPPVKAFRKCLDVNIFMRTLASDMFGHVLRRLSPALVLFRGKEELWFKIREVGFCLVALISGPSILGHGPLAVTFDAKVVNTSD